MKEIIIVVRGGMVESAYTKDTDIDIEILDLDTQDPDESVELKERLSEIENDDAYRDIL